MFFPEGQVRVFLYGQPVNIRLSFDGVGNTVTARPCSAMRGSGHCGGLQLSNGDCSGSCISRHVTYRVTRCYFFLYGDDLYNYTCAPKHRFAPSRLARTFWRPLQAKFTSINRHQGTS